MAAHAANSEELLALDPLIFSVLESLRSVSTSSPAISRASVAYPELATLLISIAQIRHELSWTTSTHPEGVAAMDTWRKQIFSLSEERDKLQGELREYLAGRGLEFEPVTVKGVARRLERDSALISFLRYKRHSGYGSSTDSLLAFVAAPDASVRRFELGAASDLEDLAAAWRASLGSADGRGIALETTSATKDTSGDLLRSRLIDPCLVAFGENQPSQLHVILDDFLFLLPLDALPAKDGEPLGESLRIHVEGSTYRLLREHDATPSTGTLLALGDVNYNASDVENPEFNLAVARPPQASDRGGTAKSFASLLETRSEVEALARLFTNEQPVLLLGDSATKQALVEHAPDARYLHIATHGWFAPPEFKSTLEMIEAEPLNRLTSFSRAEDTVRGFAPESLCGLALAGANHGRDKNGRVPGIITAEELSTLDLSNCELAVLSACETNVGIRRAGQGIQSLQTALHAAGARTTITSLWNVDDAATRRLMEIFYTKLWSENLGKADALWQAKMALRNEGHGPRDWAAWVLTGDPN